MPALRAPVWFLLLLAFGAALGSGCGHAKPDAQAHGQPFEVTEASIADVHRALRRGDCTCEQVVRAYQARIAAYDAEPSARYPNSPALRSVITVNPTAALARADELDARFFGTGVMVGPMHCVTVLAKDNYDTVDMKTTAGSLAMIDQLLYQGESAMGILLVAIVPTVRNLLLVRDLQVRHRLSRPSSPFVFGKTLERLPEEATAHLPRSTRTAARAPQG